MRAMNQMEMPETEHARMYRPDKDKLKALFPDRRMADRVRRLIKIYEHTRLSHDPVLMERDDGSHYISCLDCGRSDDEVKGLESKPCEGGIKVNE